MSDIVYKSSTLWSRSEPLEVVAGGSYTITLPSTIKTAAKSLRFVQELVDNSATVYRYNALSFINLRVEYAGDTFDNDNFMVLFNRDRIVEEGVFENSAELTLQGADSSSIRIEINNPSNETLTINSMALYESDDLQVTSVAKVLKEETIASDLIQATSVFTDSIFTQLLMTNAWSRSTRLAQSGDTVDYICAEGMELGFYSCVLGTEQEQFHITVNKAGVETTYYYWYASITGDDAYKYLTTIDPRTKHPDISDDNRNAFRFMVFTPTELSKKLSIEFAYDETGNLTPSIIYGAGDQNGFSKGYTYKNTNGFYHIYTTSSGENVGIVMDNFGVHITGWSDQHCESIKFYNNGVKIKFTGEEEHTFEYVMQGTTLTGILQDNNYLTSISYLNEDLT